MALWSTALTACVGDPRVPDVSYLTDPVDLAAEVHHTGDHLGLPFSLRKVDDALIVLDHGGAKNLHILDAESGELRASVGDIGEGPAEFRAPIAVWGGAGQVWVVDGTNQRKTRLDFSLLDRPSEWAVETTPVVPAHGLFDIVRTSRGTLLADGIFRSGRFGIIDGDGTLIREVGVLPREALERGVSRTLHTVHLAAHPDGDRLVAVGRWFPEVEILSPDGDVVLRAEAPVASEPELVPYRGGLVASDGSVNAYGDVAASRSHIFALYCGRVHDVHGVYQNFGRDVHVFDWSGKLVTVLRMDRDALAIEIDDENGRLLALQHDPVPAILRYDLPASLIDGSGVPRPDVGSTQ